MSNNGSLDNIQIVIDALVKRSGGVADLLKDIAKAKNDAQALKEAMASLQNLNATNPQLSALTKGWADFRRLLAPMQQMPKLLKSISDFMAVGQQKSPFSASNKASIEELKEIIRLQKMRMDLHRRRDGEPYKADTEALSKLQKQLEAAVASERRLRQEQRYTEGMQSRLRRVGDAPSTALAMARQNEALSRLSDPAFQGVRQKRVELLSAEQVQRKIESNLRRIATLEDAGLIKRADNLKLNTALLRLEQMRRQGIAAENAEYQQQLNLVQQISNSRAKAPAAPKRQGIDILEENRRMALTDRGRASLLAVQASLLSNYAIIGTVTNSIRASLSFAREFEAELRTLQGITGSTDTQLWGMSRTILEVAQNSKFATTEIVSATTVLAQAGFSVSDIASSLEPIVKFAGATGTDLKNAVDIVTTTITAFNLTTADTTHVVDVFTGALNRSKLNIDQLVLGFQYVGNIASQAGVTFEEITALMGGMADAGIRSGSTLGTGLRQVITELMNPSEEFQKIIKTLGLTLGDVDVKTKGVVGVFETLKKAGFTSADAMKAFEIRTAAAAIAIENQLGVIRDLERAQYFSSMAADASEKQMSSLKAQTQALTNTVQGLVAQAIQPLQDKLTSLVKWINETFQGIEGSSRGVQVAVTGVSAVLGGIFLLTIGRTLVAVAAFATGISGVTTRLAALSAAGQNMGRLTAAVTGAATAFGRLSGLMKFTVVGLALTAITTLAGYLLTMRSRSDDLSESIEQTQTKLNNLTDKLGQNQQQVEAVDQAIKHLTNRYGELEENSDALRTESIRLASQFGEMGLSVDMFGSSVGDLIGRLVTLKSTLLSIGQVDLQEKLDAEQKLLATKVQEAELQASESKSLEDLLQQQYIEDFKEGTPFLGPRTSYPERITKQQLLAMLPDDIRKAVSDLDNTELLDQVVKAGAGGDYQSVASFFAGDGTNRGMSAQLRDLDSFIKSNGLPPSAQSVLKQFYEQRMSTLSGYKGLVSSGISVEQADRALNDRMVWAANKPATENLSGIATTTTRALDDVAKRLQKTNDPMERRRELDLAQGLVEQFKAEIEGNLPDRAVRDTIARSTGMDYDSLLKELEGRVVSLTTTSQAQMAARAESEAKFTDAERDNQIAAIKRRLRVATTPEEVSSLRSEADRLRPGMDEAARQAAVDRSGLLDLFKEGVVDEDFQLRRGFENQKERFDDAQKLFAVYIQQEIDKNEEIFDDLKLKEQELARQGEGGSRRDLKFLASQLSLKLKGFQNGKSPVEAIIRAQQEGLDLIENSLGISLDRIQEQLQVQPGALPQDLGELEGLSREARFEIEKFLKNSINLIGGSLENVKGLDELFKAAEQRLKDAQAGIADERLRLAQGSSNYRALGDAFDVYSSATGGGQSGVATVVRRAAEMEDYRNRGANLRLQEKDRDSLIARAKEMETALRQAETNLARLKATPGASQTALDNAGKELRDKSLQYAEAQREATAATNELAAALEAEKQIVALTTGTIGEAIDTTMGWYMKSLSEAGNLNMTVSETLVAGLDAARTGFASFFQDVFTGTKSAGRAFQDLGVDILRSMYNVVTSKLAEQFMSLMLSFIPGFSGGGSIGKSSMNMTTAGGTLTAYQGRYVRAAQGYTPTTRDSTLIYAQPGEFIMRRSAVDLIGADNLAYLNAMGNRVVSQSRDTLAQREQPVANDNTVNVWVVSPDQKPSMGPKDILVTIAEDAARGGTFKKLVKQIQNGTL